MSKSLAVMGEASQVQSMYKDYCFQVSSAGSIAVLSDKQNTPRFATENMTRMLLYIGSLDVSLPHAINEISCAEVSTNSDKNNSVPNCISLTLSLAIRMTQIL
jgi:hypothetical protein